MIEKAGEGRKGQKRVLNWARLFGDRD